MRHLISYCLFFFFSLTAYATHVDVIWPVSNKDSIRNSAISEDGDGLLSARVTLGSKMSATATMTAPNADVGYTATSYDPTFTQFTPSTRVTEKTVGHSITFSVSVSAGHTFKPTYIEFDAAKCGTDGGNFDVYIKNGTGAEIPLETVVSPLRNKIDANNSNGYSHHAYKITDQLLESGKYFNLIIYVYNFNGSDNENPKSLALRNVTFRGEIDEPIFEASHFITAASCSAGDLFELIANLKDDETATFPTRVYGEPGQFSVTAAEGYTVKSSYANKLLTITVQQEGRDVFKCYVRFTISYQQAEAVPLNRGLMAVKTSGGVLVSWRYRASDEGRNLRFRLWRNGKVLLTKTALTDRTNYLDASGAANSTYTLEVVDMDGNVVERQADVKAWDSQTKYISLEGGAPTDPTSAGATYTPNDASFCDMDGDGEYEIILKWAPSNEKDAASSGTTSPAFYSCYKLDGKRLWMLHTGHNMFNSAHTTPFIAWDLDGDGYGEFIVKTAPGAIDGEGKYVLLDGDDPKANLKGGKGKQEYGSEYLTVFDGTTGAELKTIKYHTAYADETSSFWGDSKQNRSERYLAAIAWLDGENANPSAIFARGYYNGCKIGAYDWDGTNLTMRWLHRGESANKGTVTYANGTVKSLSTTVYGEGAHWICVGDVTGDGCQEIHYGSGALKPDGTTLYRTGLGHGDAMHLSDFIPSRPGLELFMVHEKGQYGSDLRDAATGEILLRRTASGDTGRGIMAHFNPEAENAYWQHSADAGLYDTGGNTILSECNHGGGAGLSFRVFWNEDLADDFYGKNVIEYWNPTANGFWRMQVNGGNYVYGNINNSSKQNPCVSGDILGDWREEIITWTQSDNDYQLIINATDYQTSYKVPHLMDDFAYRAQLISQNVVYNQPPHLSYDLRTHYTIERTVPSTGFDVFYAPYPVQIPTGVVAYNVTGVNATADTVRMTRLASSAIIPAGAAVVYSAKAGQTVRFVPTTKTAATVSTTYLKGCSVDSVLTNNPDAYEFFYELRYDTEHVLGFYKIDNVKQQPANTPWLRIKGSAANPPLDQYLIGCAIPTAIASTVGAIAPSTTIYTLDGTPVPANVPLQKGHVYVVDGKKVRVQ